MERIAEMRQEQDNQERDLQWMAFCYIADELDAAQRDEFEQQLATDQLARDAVVLAMEHCQLIEHAIDAGHQSAATVNVSERRVDYHADGRRWMTRFAARLIVTAAALLIMASGLTWLADSPVFQRKYEALQMARKTPVAEFTEAELAFAWADSLDQAELEFVEMLHEEGLTDVGFELEAVNEEWIFVALTELESDESVTLPGEDELE